MHPILKINEMDTRINYYYKTLYTNLYYHNVAVGQCKTPIKFNILF